MRCAGPSAFACLSLAVVASACAAGGQDDPGRRGGSAAATTACSSHACITPQNGCLSRRANTTRAVLVDFFTLNRAAAVVAIAPNSVNKGLAESSFATVAALAGDAPLLTPAPFREAGVLPMIEGRLRGQPIRGAFFLDSIDHFVRAVANASVRYRSGEG